MKKAAFYTLGCKVNQYETEAMIELFLLRGYEIVDFDLPADVYVINTCTVTAESDAKSRKYIRRAIRKNPDAVVIVVGCYSQRSPEEVLKIEGVSAVIGTADKMKAVEVSKRLLNSEFRIQNAVSSNKTVDNCFLRRECAETRSNGSEACPHEQYDYVSRVGMQN